MAGENRAELWAAGSVLFKGLVGLRLAGAGLDVREGSLIDSP